MENRINNKTHPRLLIVGTVPYNKKMQSRAFDAYFHQWEPENIVQVFSNPMTPQKGHCSELFQIKDAMMLHRWFNHNFEVGRYFKRKNCPNCRQQRTRERITVWFLSYTRQVNEKVH